MTDREPTAATKLDRPRATVVDPAPPSIAGSASLATPEQALRAYEARRAWILAVGVVILCVSTISTVTWIGGNPLGRLIHTTGLAITGVAALAYVVTQRDVSRYKPWRYMTVGFIAITTASTGFVYWGVYSAFASVVPIALYLFVAGQPLLAAVIGAAIMIVFHAGLATAQLAGWIEPQGLVTVIPGFPTSSYVIVIVVLELVVVLAAIAGIDSGRTMRRVLSEHHDALRAVAQRDALLAEAHAEVRAARAPGEGRHTGAQLGEFRLADVIGRGAMGEVYAAADASGRRCAVKVLAGHLLDNEDAVARFHREARAIASLDTPAIVRMLGVSPPGAPVPYLAMERLDGHDLNDLIKKQPVRELREVVGLVTAVAAGLDIAHGAGVIHRDLKPANIFAADVGGGVQWKVLDFGVSKLARGDGTMTAGNLVGTPGYMAPEQASGGKIDRRADVYALGIVAYRLLTGRPAVVPGEVPAMLHEVVYRMPPRPSQLADVPILVESVLAIALAKSPDDRFATAGELAAAFSDAANGVVSPAIEARAEAILGRATWGRWMRAAPD